MSKSFNNEPDLLDYTATNNKLNVIFILTLLSPCFAVMFENFLIKLINPPFGHTITFTWINWLFLPFVLYAGYIGGKYRKMGFKGRKVEIACVIAFTWLLIFGSFFITYNPNVDYSNINDYKDIINVDLPINGKLSINKYDYYTESIDGSYYMSSSDDIMKDDANPNDIVYQILRADYSKQDVTALEKGIKESSVWFINKDLTDDLKKMFSNAFKYTENNYLSIYNETTNEYNTLPTESGEYKIYVMKYIDDSKILEIHTFTYIVSK